MVARPKHPSCIGSSATPKCRTILPGSCSTDCLYFFWWSGVCGRSSKDRQLAVQSAFARVASPAACTCAKTGRLGWIYASGLMRILVWSACDDRTAAMLALCGCMATLPTNSLGRQTATVSKACGLPSSGVPLVDRPPSLNWPLFHLYGCRVPGNSSHRQTDQLIYLSQTSRTPG